MIKVMFSTAFGHSSPGNIAGILSCGSRKAFNRVGSL